ncbi:Glycoside hydrolase, family 5 [Pseudohyphozyma bogoriensis]|nr:Glycoside hydrolase, family 5 [Pseudohyphozyma bogoriensis]
MSRPYGDTYASQDALYPPTQNEKTPISGGKRSGMSPWLKFGAPIVVVIVILGAVLGGVFGSRAANNKSNAVSGAAADGSSSSSSSGSSKTGTATGTATSSASTALASNEVLVGVKPLTAWDWSADKAIGMCLGNWLLLERWMNEDWFTQTAGEDAWDEWDFSQVLGDKAVSTLQAHYDSWVNETDVEQMFQAGVNIIRVPMGFWAWIPTQGDEPYVNADQVGYLEKLMTWAYKRSMYVMIDLHGLPGSQNGEESSGHNTVRQLLFGAIHWDADLNLASRKTDPTWFGNSTNQARSDQLVQTVVDWVAVHPYRSVVAAIQPGNEFRPYTAEQDDEMESFYSRSYATIQNSSYPVPMTMHPGYYVTDPLQYWYPFAAARVTDPPSLLYEDHPYPGNFPVQNSSSSILSQVCAAAEKYLEFPVPIVITEYSLYTGVKDSSFENEFFQSQITAWTWSAGAMYWSWKVVTTQAQLASGIDYSQYSFQTVLTNTTGTIPVPSDAGLANTTTRANAVAYLGDLTSNCGAAPANVAPYVNASITPVTWSKEIAAQSSDATVILSATSTISSAVSTVTSRKRSKRSFVA